MEINSCSQSNSSSSNDCESCGMSYCKLKYDVCGENISCNKFDACYEQTSGSVSCVKDFPEGAKIWKEFVYCVCSNCCDICNGFCYSKYGKLNP